MMHVFHYRAVNRDHQPVQGELQAESVAVAAALLEAQGLQVQSIGLAPTASPSAFAAAGAISAERAALESHLAVVLPRARQISPALRAYRDELPPPAQRQFDAVLQVLERQDVGAAANAFVATPEYWIPLLSAATTAGDPGRILAVFLKECHRAIELRRQWWRTLAYPLAVCLIAAVVMTALSFLVIPTFRNIFTEFSLRLPWLTAAVLWVAAEIASGRVLLYAAIVALLGFGLMGILRLVPPSVRNWFGDRWGTPLGRSNAVARFAQYVADLLEADVNLASALRIAGFATQSGRLQRAAWRLASGIEGQGAGSSRPLTQTVLYAVTGEMPTTSRIRLLREISNCHSERANVVLSWTHGLFEPLAIMVVGGLVGIVVLALFLPLFSLLRSLSG